MADKAAEMTIEVEGADQDEALANAKAKAVELGYNRISLKNILKITYSVMLFEPIEEPVKPE